MRGLLAFSPSFWRYTAFQIPGWILAAGGGWLLHRWLDVPPWVAAGVLVVWVIKDYALYPILRFAYELDHRLPIERLIGTRGTARERLAPRGYVQVRGELWRATPAAGSPPVTRGDTVEVVAVEGTTLIVRPPAGPTPEGPSGPSN